MHIVAIMKTAESASSLRQAINGAQGADIDIHISDSLDLTKNEAAMNGHDVLLVDIAPDNGKETDLLGHFIDENCQTRPVIVTAENARREDIHRLLKLGVVDVLSHPIREIDLLVALDHAARSRMNANSGSSRKGKVISFLKGGGGAGSTTLAVQGGCVLAADAKKEKPKVCILDLDIQFGAAGLFLDLLSPVGLTDLLDSPERLDQSLFASVMAHHKSGIDVLTAPTNILPLESVSPEFVDLLLKFACEAYDYVLVDLPQSWTSWTYTALSRSDLIVLVSQLSVASVRQTVHQINTLRVQDLENVPIKHVINRYRRNGISSSAELKDAEIALGRKFDYRIANNYELVSEAVNQGVMLAKVQRRSKTEKNIRKMMTDIRQYLSISEQREAVHAVQ